ncbi:hypothetical protein FACS1894214_0870 [Planctomycetales bacterium]|nr:hypothetical protein FACS1894214_0870 [Planctomycetales bacterium]
MVGINTLAVVLITVAAILAVSVILAVAARNIILGFCVAVAAAILSFALGGLDKIFVFWDAPSFLLVTLTVAILVGGQGKWKLFLQGMKTSFSSSPLPNVPDTAEIAALFRYIANGTLWGGGLWTLTGLVLVLADFDPDKIAPGIAVSALTLFYSFIVSVFFFQPIAYRYEQSACTDGAGVN